MSEPHESRSRIALVLGTSTGGVGVHVQSLAGHLVADGWQVTVCAPASTLAVFDFPGAARAVVPIRATAGLEFLTVPALRRATAGAALVHAHGLRAGTAAALPGAGHGAALLRPHHDAVPAGASHDAALPGAARRERQPLVVTWHNAVLAAGLRAALLGAGERFVARRATLNLAASPDLAARIECLGGAAEVAPVAAPRPRPNRSSGEVRVELGIAEDRPLVVSVGRLHSQKAHDVLIHAAAQWSRRTPAPLVVIAGDGPQQVQLARLVADIGAPVRLLGRRTDVADLLNAADVVALASRWEARPLALQEAMTLGRAVVATDVGGVAQLVGDGAVLVPAGDADALASAVQRLLDDAEARARLGARAQVQAATWPDEQDTARACVRTYRRLLG